jgi:hemolysin D
MPNYRRAFAPGGCWFFTVNLLERRKALLVDHIDALRAAVEKTRSRYPFAIELKLEAFPFTRYGLVQGRVRKLGRDAATNPNAAPPGSLAAMAQAPQPGASGAPPAELAYPAKVTLLQDWIVVDGRHETIRAGMRVSAEIKTGDRRVIEYILSPVMQAVKEAGRER